jgi:hypothetical protein
VWDYSGEMTMLHVFWDAPAALDPLGATALDETLRIRFCRRGELGQLSRGAGIERVEEVELPASARYADFEELWSPFEAGAGPTGAYCKALGTGAQAALREECWRRLGLADGPVLPQHARMVCARTQLNLETLPDMGRSPRELTIVSPFLTPSGQTQSIELDKEQSDGTIVRRAGRLGPRRQIGKRTDESQGGLEDISPL